MTCRIKMRRETLEFQPSKDELEGLLDWWKGDKFTYVLVSEKESHVIVRDTVVDIDYHEDDFKTRLTRTLKRELSLPATGWFNILTVGGISLWLHLVGIGNLISGYVKISLIAYVVYYVFNAIKDRPRGKKYIEAPRKLDRMTGALHFVVLIVALVYYLAK